MDISLFLNIIGPVKSILIFALFLAVLILVHEWGHFITAKRLGVHVEQFAIGFGPTIYSRHHDGTDYMIKLFPLGGYVKMAGDERSRCKGEADEFFSKPVGHRGLIILNGPVVNYVLAFVCLVFVFFIGYPDSPARVGEVIEGLPAQEAGLQVGDKIIEIDSAKIYGWTEMQIALMQSRNEHIELKIQRDGQEITKSVPPKIDLKRNIFGQTKEFRSIGIGPYTNVVGEVLEGEPAEAAGIKPGDKIIEIDSTEIGGWNKLYDVINESKNDQVQVTFLREGKKITKAVKVKVKKIKALFKKDKEQRAIGLVPEFEVDLYKFDFGQSIALGYNRLMQITFLTYEAIYDMLTGFRSAEDSVAGPVGIFQIVTESSDRGFSHLLSLFAIISASLAIFNLLPLIPLDGGHLFLLSLEKLRGKPLPEKVDDLIARFGFLLIISLALFVFYTDFVRIGLFNKIIWWR